MTKTHRLQGRVLNGDAMPAWPMPRDVGPLQPTGKPGEAASASSVLTPSVVHRLSLLRPGKTGEL